MNSSKELAESMASETDFDLLTYMSMKDEPEHSRAAFAEFHKRYGEFIYNAARQVCCQIARSDDLATELAQNVFIAVFERAGSFDPAKADVGKNPRSQIEGWLSGTAKGELRSLMSANQLLPPDESNEGFRVVKRTPQGRTSQSYSAMLVHHALKQLKERDQHIVMMYWLYYEKGVGSQAKNLPDNILEELCRKYETSKPNLRKIIERGNAKIKQYLLEHFKPDNPTRNQFTHEHIVS